MDIRYEVISPSTLQSTIEQESVLHSQFPILCISVDVLPIVKDKERLLLLTELYCASPEKEDSNI